MSSSPHNISTALVSSEVAHKLYSGDSKGWEVFHTPSPISTEFSERSLYSPDDLQTSSSSRSALSPAISSTIDGIEAQFAMRPKQNCLSISTTYSSSLRGSTSSSVSPGIIDTSRFHTLDPSSESPLNEDVIPKIEEMDDEDMNFKMSKMDQIEVAQKLQVVKKRPGRPPKQSNTNGVSKPCGPASRTPKGRSKTGCLTCRRRKKKCDEAKPTCECCRKNNVHCEGYPEKDYWKSGKQKAADAQNQSSQRLFDLPPLIKGVENEVDRHLLRHFETNLCRVLTLHAENSKNPFKELLLPMAFEHQGLMHSLLSLSASHMLVKQPEFNSQIEDRQMHHEGRAVHILRSNSNFNAFLKGDSTIFIDDATKAQVIILCQTSICDGNIDGEYRGHLNTAKHFIETQQCANKRFQEFLVEFSLYQNLSNIFTSTDKPSIWMMGDFNLPEFMIQPEAGALLGVVDSLFGFISKTRQLRDQIRKNKKENLQPAVPYEIMAEALEVKGNLDEWSSPYERDSPRFTASMLYRIATWLYLYRTTQPCKASAEIVKVVDEGLAHLKSLPGGSATRNILLMPLFVLGCSAFEPRQRPEIRQAFDDLLEHSSMLNIKYARQIVDEVWMMMDAEDERSWDWETIMSNKGWDFLIT